MTAQSQAIAPTGEITSFAGLPRGENNIYPRARIVFEDATAIALKIATDTNVVIYTFSLPANYAYRLDQFSIGFFDTGSVDTDNFENLGLGFLDLTAGVSANQFTVESPGDTFVNAVTGGAKSWGITRDQRYGEIFFSQDPTPPRMRIQLFDNDATENTDALSSLTHVSFLQYDIEQLVNVAVNAPQPVTTI